MDEDALAATQDLAAALPQSAVALIFAGAVLLRAIPFLILISTLIKLRRFQALRRMHYDLFAATLLLFGLALFDTFAPEDLARAVHTSQLGSFAWIFAAAWLAVTWTRSAIKTRLRPRVLDIATLTCTIALLAALIVPLTIAP